MITAKTLLTRTFVLILLVVTLSGCGGRIGALLDLGANEKLKRKTVREETESYEAIKKALLQGSLKKDMTHAEVLRRYGRPVLTYPERDGSTRLVYKATASDWIKGEKIYLFFEPRNTFVRAECVNCS
ncbi:MAG: hypothetical protein ABH865_00780 [Candidatus Omnitrophota bacterium]|nr:hypothetical protein [Candidatus Omnitrophota bacterium]